MPHHHSQFGLMNSPKLSAWLTKQKKSKNEATLIESSLLNGNLTKYFVYRFKYFALKSVLTLAIAIIQTKILIDGFASTDFILHALGAGAAATLISSFWWAGLECFREEIRKQKRSENGGILIPQVLLLWRSITIKAMRAVAALSFGSFALWLMVFSPSPLSPFNLYLFALLLRVILDIPLRSFHSSVYATRRIYKPMGWVLGIEALSFIGFLLLHPSIGPWSVGVVTLIATTLNFSVSWYYIQKMFAYMGYSKALVIAVKKLKRPYPSPLFSQFILNAIPLTLFKVDALIMVFITISHDFSSGVTIPQIALLATAIPMLHITQEWAQLMYFDYKKLELHYLTSLRQSFERASRLIPLLIGGGLWACLVPAIWLVAYEWVMPPLSLLVLLCGSTYLAQSVIKHYSLGEKSHLLIAGCFLSLALCPILFITLDIESAYLAAALPIIGITIILNKSFKKRAVQTYAATLLTMSAWLISLKGKKGLLLGGSITLKEGDTSLYFLKLSLAKGIRKVIRNQNLAPASLHITSIQPSTVLFFTTTTEPYILDVIKTAAGPHLQSLSHYIGTPLELVNNLATLDEALTAVNIEPPVWKHNIMPLTFDLNDPSSNPHIACTDAQEIYHSAKDAFLKLTEPKKWNTWDVTIEEKDGVLTTIHAYPKNTPKKIRDIWRKTILKKTIYSAWNSSKQGKDQEKELNLHPSIPFNNEP